MISRSLFEARWFFRMNVNIKMLCYCAADMTHTGRRRADRQATEALGLRRDSEVFLLLLGRGDRETDRTGASVMSCEIQLYTHYSSAAFSDATNN